MKSHKPLGELYSGGPERSIDSELTAEPETTVTEKVKEIRQLMETANNRINFLHKELRANEDELQLVNEKIAALTLKRKVADSSNDIDLEKTNEDLLLRQKLAEDIKKKMVKNMGLIKGYEEEIKKLEEQLMEEGWKNEKPAIGDA